MFVDEKREGEVTTPTGIEQWRQCLIDAADLLERSPHFTGTCLHTPGVPYQRHHCVITAVCNVPRWLGEDNRLVRDYALDRVRDRVPGGHIAHWNDHVATKEMAVQLMRDVAGA